MKAAWVQAERDSEVREAARAWRKSNVIDAAALAAIEEIYSAVWPKPVKTWSVLLFFFISCFVVGLLFSLGSAHALGLTAFLLAGGLAFAADRLRQSASTVGSAAGDAAAFWSVVCLLIGTGEAVHWRASVGTLVLLVGSLAWAAAAWRWGYPAFATFAAVFFFLLLARFLLVGRSLWLILGAALAAACVPLLDRPALAPSHRRGAAAVLAVSLAAVYAAINLYSFDHGLIEGVSDSVWGTAPTSSAVVRTLSAIATGVFPLLVLGWGIRARRTLLLDAGIVGAALSLVTLRFYVHIAPLWTILSVAGSGVILLALGVYRWLARSPGREAGFTAEPLFEDKDAQQALGAVGALSLTPEARVAPAEPGKFTGGGGGFGGAGSSGTF